MHLLKFLIEGLLHFYGLLQGLEVVKYIHVNPTLLGLFLLLQHLLLLSHLPFVLHILFLFILFTLHLPDLSQLNMIFQPLIFVFIVDHIC